MDEYVEFMKKYNATEDKTSMMSDYADMTSKEADMVRQLDDIDQKSLSNADLAYYLDVTARCEKKLAEVM